MCPKWTVSTLYSLRHLNSLCVDFFIIELLKCQIQELTAGIKPSTGNTFKLHPFYLTPLNIKILNIIYYKIK